MKVGEVNIDGGSDGAMKAPASLIFRRPDSDWEPHKQFLDEDGNITFGMGGFLVRTGDRVVLIDVGIGPNSNPELTGMFLQSLQLLGVKPEEVTDVALTHLHFDHIG